MFFKQDKTRVSILDRHVLPEDNVVHRTRNTLTYMKITPPLDSDIAFDVGILIRGTLNVNPEEMKKIVRTEIENCHKGTKGYFLSIVNSFRFDIMTKDVNGVKEYQTFDESLEGKTRYMPALDIEQNKILEEVSKNGHMLVRLRSGYISSIYKTQILRILYGIAHAVEKNSEISLFEQIRRKTKDWIPELPSLRDGVL